MLPLPYGETTTTSSGRQYGTLQEEATRISTSLIPIQEPGKASANRYGAPSQPVPLIKTVIQACFDIPKLRNEIYCQVIKLTTNPPNPGSQLNMVHWYLLACMCSTFLPARKFLRFLRFHLRRTIDDPDVKDEVSDMSAFCLELLKRTKVRDFPPSTLEVNAIMSRKDLTCPVAVVGGKLVYMVNMVELSLIVYFRVLDVPVNSSATCGDVIAFIKRELGLVKCINGFGLFENCGSVQKYLEEKVVALLQILF